MDFLDGMLLGYLTFSDPNTWFKFIVWLGILSYFIFRLLKPLLSKNAERKHK
jgi:hypothetical protein